MKLGAKLLLAPLLTACVVLSIAAGNALLQHRSVMRSHAVLRENTASLRTITAAKDQLSQIHASVYRTVSLISSLDDVKVKDFRASVHSQLDGLKRTFSGVDAAGSVLNSLVALGKQLDQYGKQADTAIDMSTVDPNTGIAAMQNADATFNAATGALGHAVSQMEAGSFEAMEASDVRSTRYSLILGALALAACGFVVTLAWWLQRKVVADLQQACQLAHDVAGGNLAVEVRSARRDEVGDLMRALGGMAHQLNVSLTTVKQSSSSIRAASSDIAGGNQNLSKRTEQTAHNLQHAASSMEQLTSTVKHSADSARQANQLANSAAEVAARGGSVVAQVVSTMDEINASSKKIGDIIGVIDAIAFQTNILALNAAVEAARAGEQGRGFAVVAAEVRSLAQRSARAAREIKGLIGASVDKVEAGSRLVADAGATMREIVGSVQRVSNIIGEISSASGEQSQGIDRVSAAVTDLDQMTQQNAALVEQSAAAAESLRDQAGRLAQVVSVFQLRPAAAGSGCVL